MKEFGENLKIYREKKGITQSELAKKCYVTSQMICSIENGAKQPSLNLALGLAQVLDTNVETLAGLLKEDKDEKKN